MLRERAMSAIFVVKYFALLAGSFQSCQKGRYYKTFQSTAHIPTTHNFLICAMYKNGVEEQWGSDLFELMTTILSHQV